MSERAAQYKSKKAIPRRTTKVDSPLVIRTGGDLLERLDELVPLVAADGALATLLGGVSRSSVARLALVEGLVVVEARLKSGKSKKG